MKREAQTLTVGDVRSIFAEIEFPDYQREPTVWNRDQKQRLIDSILRKFDIAAIYLYHRDDGGLECIDGRQRLNAVMSFLGDNQTDADNRFVLHIENEVARDEGGELQHLDGLPFDQLDPSTQSEILEYEMVIIFLSGFHAPEEFNLQFLRLNLGTLINAGEKLHAMVGEMRDLLFESRRLGLHPFLDDVGVPTRRYAREQVAAQVMLQVFARSSEANDFARARHYDLQRFVKEHTEVGDDARVREVMKTLDVLSERASDIGPQLGNRAICVSVIVAAWDLKLFEAPDTAAAYGQFVEVFLGRLRWQVQNMKSFAVDQRYAYLVEFQRHLTQAAVEKPAVRFRHETLTREFARWTTDGDLAGDARYREDVGDEPPWLPLG